MSIAVYAGTFDPITSGHLSVLRQAARIFAHVRVLVAVNPDKNTLFDVDERVGMIREVVAAMPQVSVDATEGLVVEYAAEIGATTLVRGIRGSSDATFETELAQQNRELAPEISTVLLPAEPALAAVSSSSLKEQVRLGHEVVDCPPLVLARVKEKLGVALGTTTHRRTLPLGADGAPSKSDKPLRGTGRMGSIPPTLRGRGRISTLELGVDRAPGSESGLEMIAEAERLHAESGRWSTQTIFDGESGEVERDTLPPDVDDIPGRR